MSTAASESVHQAPLTDREVELVRRLFSDPFSFPLEYKAWLKAFLEADPPLLPAGAISGLAGAISGGVPLVPGMMMQYGGDGDPSTHWLICDGRALSRTTYATLFTNLGTRHGAGDGSTTFNIPDTLGRVLVGKGTHVDVNAVGKSDGLAASVRRWLHKHTFGNPAISAPTHSLTLPDHKHAAEAMTGFALWGGVGNADQASQPGSNWYVGYPNTGGATSLPAINGSIGAPSASGGTVGPQTGAEPTDGPAALVVNHIVYVG